MEKENKQEIKQITAAQEILISKILKSSKLLDKEYRELRETLDSKVVTSFDAAVFINYVLGILKFRRHFYNGKHKAYKKCFTCGSRENIQRYLNVKEDKKYWLCETCAINIDPSEIVLTKLSEEREVKADFMRKEMSAELNSSQEDLVCEHREQ